jgi:hypothetical protein
MLLIFLIDAVTICLARARWRGLRGYVPEQSDCTECRDDTPVSN